VLDESGSTAQFLRLGLPDRFIDHGDQSLLLTEVGLDKEGIVRAVRAYQDRTSLAS
jgi:1-deoxy-D-xylulose-5-phosphate synthase